MKDLSDTILQVSLLLASLLVGFLVILIPVFVFFGITNEIEKGELENKMKELQIKEIIKNRTNIYDDCKFYDSKYYCE